jgi:splicing factor U2AF subunit
VAIEGLNGMDLAGSAIKVTRASIGFTQGAGLEMGVNAMSMFAGTTSDAFEEGRVLQLLNMVTAEELIDNDDYEGKGRSHTSALLGPTRVDADNL